MMEAFRRILACVVGLLLVAGSVYMWHVYHVIGLVACIVGATGLSLINYYGLDRACPRERTRKRKPDA